MIEGTAASRSVTKASALARRRGAYSAMNSAMPIPTGTASSMAMTAETRVPNARAAIPKTGGLPSGFQLCSVKKFAVFDVSDGVARQMRNRAIAAMMTSTREPAPKEIPRKTRSPRRTLAPLMGELVASV